MALVLVLVFSLGCGLCQTLVQLVVCRALQGVGGSGLYSLAFTALPEVTPIEKFGIVSTLIGIALTLAAVL